MDIEEEYKIFFERYEVSNHGNVRFKISTGIYRKVKGSLQKNGYYRTNLYPFDKTKKAKSEFVHRMVALAFLGEPPTPYHVVDHKDRNKVNNHLSNLRWATVQENAKNSDNFKDYVHERKLKDGTIRYFAIISYDDSIPRKTFDTREEAIAWIIEGDFEDVKRIQSPGYGHIEENISKTTGLITYKVSRYFEGENRYNTFDTREECQQWIDKFKDPTFRPPPSKRRKSGTGHISPPRVLTDGKTVKYDAKIKINGVQDSRTFDTEEEAEIWLASMIKLKKQKK